MDEIQIGTMVDTGAYDKKEKTERPKKTLSKNMHHIGKGDPQNIYHEEKSRYQAAIKKEKLNSWKEYCNLTPSTNPWNTVYKITTNKHRRVLPMTTLLKSDGS